MQFLSKSQQVSLQKLKAYPKIQMEVQKAQNSQINFEREKIGSLTDPAFKTHYKVQ